MKKSKILGIALAAALITSAASMTAFAKMTESSEISGLSLGITGSFCNWGNSGETDVPMTDADGDGVYEGTFEVGVTEDMIQEATTDDGTNIVSRGFSGVKFKVRTNGSWGDSWGEFEEAYNRTYNSQTDCCAEAVVGDNLKITVKLDTNTVADQSNQNPDDAYEAGADDAFNVWPVSFTVEKVAGETPAEESPAEETPAEESPASEAPASTAPATEAGTDTTTVGTGDTTSAVALVAVVLASLGVAVVMTKKASSKE